MNLTDRIHSYCIASLALDKNNLLFFNTLFHISKKLPKSVNMSSGREEILAAMDQFEKLQEKYLPKVDHKLVIDLFSRLREDPNDRPMYTIEAFLDGGDPEEIRNEVIRLTGTAPQMHDRGTHLVAHHRMDYELLKQIQDNPKVREVTGTYMGSDASIGASHEPSTHSGRRDSQSRNY